MNARAAAYRKARPGYGAAAVRRSNLKQKYNLTEEEYNDLLEEQNGQCLICGETPEEPLAVDHDHATGVVRGLLCPQCNRGLGHFRDNIDYLQAAITYLARQR